MTKHLVRNLKIGAITLMVSMLVCPKAFAEEGGGLVHGSPWLPFAYSWLAIIILVVAGFLSTRKLDKVPTGIQNFMEMLVGGLEDFFLQVLGPGGERHAPILITMFLFILTMNLFGLTGFLVVPTTTLNQTIALALVAFVYVQYQGIRANGILGYIKHFLGEPIWLAPLNFPLHIIGEIAKPLSLSMRLFGNMFGEETVVVQITLLGPLVLFGSHVLPLQFPLLVMGLLKCVIQALVFTVLTSAYLVMMTSHDDHGHSEHHEPAHAAA